MEQTQKKPDFYTTATPLAFVVGFLWIYFSMTILKIPGWPAMVAMAGYYAVGGLSCHKPDNNFSRGLKGFLLGIGLSWIGVTVWTIYFKGNPMAMATVMGIVAALMVFATKLGRGKGGEGHFVAMPQTFLGATIYFGIFNIYMTAKLVPAGVLNGMLQSYVLAGPAQPHVAGILALLSTIIGLLLGFAHQKISLTFSAQSPE